MLSGRQILSVRVIAREQHLDCALIGYSDESANFGEKPTLRSLAALPCADRLRPDPPVFRQLALGPVQIR